MGARKRRRADRESSRSDKPAEAKAYQNLPNHETVKHGLESM